MNTKAKGAERKQRMETSKLMAQILSKENFNAAYLQVVRNKGTAGVDGMTVEELDVYLLENSEGIREAICLLSRIRATGCEEKCL